MTLVFAEMNWKSNAADYYSMWKLADYLSPNSSWLLTYFFNWLWYGRKTLHTILIEDTSDLI